MRITEAELRALIREELTRERKAQDGEATLDEVSGIKTLVSYLKDNDIPYEIGGKHLKVKPKGNTPDTPVPMVTMPLTPGGGNRALDNAIATLKRALEASAQAQGRRPYPPIPRA